MRGVAEIKRVTRVSVCGPNSICLRFNFEIRVGLWCVDAVRRASLYGFICRISPTLSETHLTNYLYLLTRI